jgi:hypothetical protein
MVIDSRGLRRRLTLTTHAQETSACGQIVQVWIFSKHGLDDAKDELL